jgi:hypothetical protein
MREVARDLGVEPLQHCGIARVADEAVRTTATCLHLRNDCRHRVRLAVEHGHLDAGSRQGERHRLANARRAAHDRSHPAGEGRSFVEIPHDPAPPDR